MKTPMHLKKKILVSLIGTSLMAMGAAPSVSWAQTSNARLRGHAPANTQITAFNVATGATRHAQSNAQGRYTIPGLPPGTYQISAGNGTPKTVTLSVASSVTLDLSGAAKSNGATATATPSTANAQNLSAVTVSGTALQEVKTPEIATTISQHQIQFLPQATRNFLEFADTVPGVVFTVNGQNHNTSLRGGAQNNNQVNVYIDGVGQKSYVVGGGIAGQNATQGNPFPQLAIGQYKVITSNYKAEYDQVSSVGITAQTKSGTNQFHGEIFDRYTSGKFRARTPAENFKPPKVSSFEREFGASLGGPIIKNVAHFFLTYSGKRFLQPTTVGANNQAVAGEAYLPPDVKAQLGPANIPFTENLYFGKIDVEPTDRDRFELSGTIRNEHQRGGIGGTTALSASFNTIHPTKSYVLKWDHSANLWFNDLIITHQKSSFGPTPLNFGNGSIYTYPVSDTNDATIIQTGSASPLAGQAKNQEGNTFKDNLTFNDIQWYGNHVIKMGVVYRDLTLTARDAFDVNPQFTYQVDSSGVAATPYKAFFTKGVTGLGGLTPKVVTSDKQFGGYIQDDWDVTDRLQLNLGVRWDAERVPAYLDFVAPANVVAAFNGPNTNTNAMGNPAPDGETYAEALAKGGININDYLGNGHNRSTYKGEWQPRLGFSYDIDNDEAHVIHGGAGRSYDRNLYNYLQLEKTKAALPQFTVYFKDPSTGLCHQDRVPCLDFDPKYLQSLSNLQQLKAATNKGAEVDLLNNDLKAPYSDQFSLGMSNKIGDWQTDVTVTRILYYDGFAFTLGNRYPDGAFFQKNKKGANVEAYGQAIPGFGSLIIGNNGIRTRNTQVLLSANKPYTEASGWGVTFAYTHTDAKQNRDINEHYSFDRPTIQDYPFILSNAAAEHRIVATGTFAAPWGFKIGAKLTLETPTPFNGIAGNGDATFPNGSSGIPIAARPPGAGKFLVGGKIWGYRDLDLQISKDFELPYGIAAYARFDLLNAFNFNNYTGLIVDSIVPPGNVTRSDVNTQIRLDPNGNIRGYPRTIKLTVGARF